jgi:hypothetical protein
MNKFVKLYESSIQRYTRGGFLTGDLVKFVENAFKDDFFKNQAPNYVNKARSFADAGLNMRVSAVKAVRPTIHSGDVQNEAEDFIVDITLEMAPGLYREFLTVPARLLQQIDTYPNLAPVPDSLKRKGDININPKEVKQEQEENTMLSPHRQTQTSDLGNSKDSEGERKLNNFNTSIPSSPSQGTPSPSVEKGTFRYLPKR